MVCLALLLLAVPSTRAQKPVGAVGHIVGTDVSVENGPAFPAGLVEAQMLVGNGSVVTVHAGHAQLLLKSGGEADICGPAKFTLLSSGTALTIALDFGSLHLRMRGAVPVKIYTPQIIATPIAIASGAREVTVGLDLNDSLCVLSSQGALRLEQQFTGGGLIVPQTGEFFLTGSQLAPVVGTPGSCRCTSGDDSGTRPRRRPLPDPAEIAAVPPAAMAAAAPQPTLPAARSSFEVNVPTHANTLPPAAPAPQNTSATPPRIDPPEWKVILPPLSFTAKALPPPEEADPQTILLVRETRVEPDWFFRGTVEAPSVGRVNSGASALAVTTARKTEAPSNGGFFARLKRVFAGGAAGPRPCAGAGCTN